MNAELLSVEEMKPEAYTGPIVIAQDSGPHVGMLEHRESDIMV